MALSNLTRTKTTDLDLDEDDDRDEDDRLVFDPSTGDYVVDETHRAKKKLQRK